MVQPVHTNLSRRERQIMDALFQRGRATAAEILKAIPSPPSYSAVRAMLRVLEEKGHVRHDKDGRPVRRRPERVPEAHRDAPTRHRTVRRFF